MPTKEEVHSWLTANSRENSLRLPITTAVRLEMLGEAYLNLLEKQEKLGGFNVYQSD
jgi:hypothetical protein